MRKINPILIIILLFSSCRRHELKNKGCTSEMEIITSNYNADSVKFFIPNAFTPDDDGINDRFQVYGSGIISSEMKIYKRKKLIFDQKGENLSWGGDYQGTLVKPGIFKYELTLITIHNEKIEIEGEVSLIPDPGSKEYNSIKNCSGCLFGDMIDPKEGFIYQSHNIMNCD